LIKCAGATKNTSKKINVHGVDIDLFAGLNWLHSLREMQLDTATEVHNLAEAYGDPCGTTPRLHY